MDIKDEEVMERALFLYDDGIMDKRMNPKGNMRVDGWMGRRRGMKRKVKTWTRKAETFWNLTCGF